MTDEIKAFDKDELQTLIDCDIIAIKGISGKVTTLDVAMQAPSLCKIHAMSGKVFEITGCWPEVNLVTVEEVK